MATNSASLYSTGRNFPSNRAASDSQRTQLRLVPTRLATAQDRSSDFDLANFLESPIAGKTNHAYLPGDSIFLQGDPSHAVFYVQSGQVQLTVVSMSGKEAVIAHLPAGSYFGESALAGVAPQFASASSLGNSAIVRIDRKLMQTMLQREPGLVQHFLAHLVARKIRMEADLVDQLFNSSEKRLARLLLLMASNGQDATRPAMIARISQETLAEMIGTTRSRVSFFLNRFRELGYVDYDCAGMRVKSSLQNVLLRA